jgi:hypothetical protein
MPVGARFLAWPTAPRTGNPVSMGHAHAAPYQHSWDIPKNAVPAPDRGSGAAHRAQGPPAPLQQGAWPPQKHGILAVFFFFTHPSDIHGPATVWIPEHTPGPALHEAGTCAHPPRPQFSGPRIIANPTAPRPGNSVSMGHAHAAPPINTPGIYPRTRYQRLTGVPGRRLPTESKGSRPPYGREPGPPRNPRNFGCFFLFTHLSDMHRPATARIPGRTPGPTLHGAGTCARPPRPRFSGPRTIIANLLVC